MEIKKDNCLKNIIKEKLCEYDQKISLIFTTFDYDTTFFETQLLPYLFDTEKYVKSSMRGKLVAHELYQKLKEIDLKVFYNHFKGDIQSDVNFKSFENQTDKLLHAKLIIVIGKKNEKKTMTVIVTSANLTTSSYGTNLEVVGTIENDDENIISQIEGSDSLENILNALNKIKELAITGIGKENKIENELNKSNTINVITPFLEEKIIDNYKTKSDLKIIFTNLRGLKNKDKYKDYDFIRVYPKSERKIHSKIYLLDEEKVIIGSHNFTTNAITGKNIEASLIYENKELYKDCKANFDAINNKCSDLDKMLDVEINEISETEIKTSKNIYVSKAEIDWKGPKILFELKPKLDKRYEIKSVNVKIEKSDLKWNNIKFDYNKGCWNLEEIITEKVKDSIFENKFFEMTIEFENNNEIENLIGILYEKDPIDPIEKLEGKNFNDILKFLYTNNANFIDMEDNDFQNILENTEVQNNVDNKTEETEQFNITDMFFAFKKLNIDINNYIDNNQEDKIKEFYITNPKSIKRLSYLFNNYYEKEDNIGQNKRKILYYLLTCNELKLLWSKENKILSKLKEDEEIDNIIKRNEKILEELKEFAINLMRENNEIIKSLKKPEQDNLLKLFLDKF